MHTEFSTLLEKWLSVLYEVLSKIGFIGIMSTENKMFDKLQLSYIENKLKDSGIYYNKFILKFL
jgi:hypothetical protein